MNNMIAGVILAGGRSSRMGGIDKGNLKLAGKSLIQRVVERFAPQVSALAINSAAPYAEDYGYPVIPDNLAGFHGPLMGLLSAFEHSSLIEADKLALAPCDCPFLPPDLVITLSDYMIATDSDVAMVSYEGVWQPTFSLWHRRVAPQIAANIKLEQPAGLKAMARQLKTAVVEWPLANPAPFFNINTLADLSRAEELLQGSTAINCVTPSDGYHVGSGILGQPQNPATRSTSQ